MKITMYELLGLVKDSKAPKKIKYDNIIFEYDGIYYMAEHTYLDEYCDLSRVLNDEVEILEEEKKIEPLKMLRHSCNFDRHEEVLYENQVDLARKITEIIDRLNESEEN